MHRGCRLIPGVLAFALSAAALAQVRRRDRADQRHGALTPAELGSRARALAAEITVLPAAAIAACKRCIAAPLAGANGYEAEVSGTAALLADAETQKRVRAFLERRQ